MNIITQEVKKNQAIVERAIRKGKSEASRIYGVNLSIVKRWCKRYNGTWQSLINKPRRPHSHPKRHTVREEKQIKNSFKKHFQRHGWDGVYSDLLRKGYKRSYSGTIYAGKRMGLVELKIPRRKAQFSGDIRNYWHWEKKFRLMWKKCRTTAWEAVY